MPSLRKKKSKKAKPVPAEAPAPSTPITTPAPHQSPHASPHPSIDASPRESPFKRLLRRSTSSLGDSWRGLKNRRRESVSSVLGSSPAGTSGVRDERGQEITVTRSRGSEVNASPDAGHGNTSRSGSIRGTPVRARHDHPGSAESMKSGHHRAASSISSLTTFPAPNPVTPVKPSGGTAAVRESNVVSVETIASSRDQPVSSGESAQRGPEAMTASSVGLIEAGGAGRNIGSLGLDFTPARDPIHATYTAPLTPPTPPTPPEESIAQHESPRIPEQHPGHAEQRVPVLAPALGIPVASLQQQQQQQQTATASEAPRSSYIRPHPSVQPSTSTASLGTDVFGTVAMPSPARASERSLRTDVSHGTTPPPPTADWIATPPTTVADLDAVAQLEKGDAKVEVKEVGTSVSDEKRMKMGDEAMHDQEPKTPASPRLGSLGGTSVAAETHVGTPYTGTQDLEIKPPSSPRLGMAGSTLEETYTHTEDQEHASKPPSSPRLKPIGIIPDIPVPAEPFIPGILGIRPDQHLHVIHALEPVLEETPKATEIERFAGLPYLDDTKHRRDKGKGKAVDQGQGVVAVRTSGQKKLHMFEGGNTTKARHATTPPHSPSFDDNLPGPSTPPLTHKPLDRTTYPPAPPTPPRIRWEAQRIPNRAQHTEQAALDPPPYEGGLHEAGAGGISFTRHGEAWIGRPPASLDSVALRALALEERERGRREREREGVVRRQARQLNTQVVGPRIIITPPASPTTTVSQTTIPTSTQPPMLPFIPRIFAPRLNLDFQWADTWLPSDVVLEAADPEVPTESISLYESIRNWAGLAATAPSRRITNYGHLNHE